MPAGPLDATSSGNDGPHLQIEKQVQRSHGERVRPIEGDWRLLQRTSGCLNTGDEYMATQAIRNAGNIRHREQTKNCAEKRLANGLGWFSIGLGLAELAAPRQVARLIGARDEDQTRTVLRAYGIRELAAGFGILSQNKPTGWLWGRVAGDMLDIASLGRTLSADDSKRGRTVAATAAVVGVTALDLYCAQRLSRSSEDAEAIQDGSLQSRARSERTEGRTEIRKTTTVNRSPEEVYQFWHDFTNLPTFMQHLESVEITGGNRSHWKAKAPAGRTVEWDAEVTEDQPNRRIAWRSLEGSDVQNSGSVQFDPAPGGRGTQVKVELQYSPPGGAIGATVAKLFNEEPGQQIADDLRAFKQVMETGEITKSDASIHRGMHAAQPPKAYSHQSMAAKSGR
jgi:uncharacterized membrane protein